jgi:hypothetical protein
MTSLALFLPKGDSAPQDLHFSTSSASTNFSTTMNVSGPFVDVGIVLTKMYLMFGLSNPGSTWKLSDIISYLSLPVQGTASLLLAFLKVAEDFSAPESGDPGLFVLGKGMIWVSPDDGNSTVQRMEWSLNTNIIAKWLSWIPKLTVTKSALIARRKFRQTPKPNGEFYIQEFLSILMTTELEIENIGSKITTVIDFDVDGDGSALTLALNFSPKSVGASDEREFTLGSALDWVGTLLEAGSNRDFPSVTDFIPKLDAAKVRRIELKCAWAPGKKPQIARFKIDVELMPGWKDGPNDDPDSKEIALLVSSLPSVGELLPFSLG